MAHPSTHKPTKPKPVKVKAPKKPKLSKAARKQAYTDQTLYNPSEILSGESLRKSVASQVEGQVKPQINAANRAIETTGATADEQSRRAGEYYKQLAAEEGRNYDLQSALREKTRGALSMISQEAADKIGAAGQEADTRAAQDASVRGPGLEGGARERLAQEMAARAGNQAFAAQAYRTQGGELQGQNFANLLLANKQSSAARGGETQGTIRNRAQVAINDLIGKRTDIAASRGPLTAKLLNEMRGSEFEKLATVQGLGLKRGALAQDAADAARRAKDNAANRRLTARGQNVTRSGQLTAAETAAANRKAAKEKADADRASREGSAGYQGKGGKGAAGKPPKAATQGKLNRISKIRGIYRANRGRPQSKIAEGLRGMGFSDAEIAAGADLATRGAVLKSTRQKYGSELGLLPSSWRGKPKAKYVKPAYNTAAGRTGGN